MSVQILSGTIVIYRVFDIAEEIALNRAEEVLKTGVRKTKWSLPKNLSRAIQIRSFPLDVDLGKHTVNTRNGPLECELRARVRDYGVITILMQIPMPAHCGWNSLVDLAIALEESVDVDELAQKHAREVKEAIKPALKDPHDWTSFEDYVVYFIEKYEGAGNTNELLKQADIPSLILAEKNLEISERTQTAIRENIFQYSSHDLVVIDWNSAIVVEPEGKTEILELLELSLTHLMEMRYYDDLLDQKLTHLYDEIEKSRLEKRVFWNNTRYDQISKEASARYIEFSEFLERIENSLKFVGDFYFATVLRATARRFRLSDWQQNITRKMNILAQVSNLMQGELNIRRSHWLEMIIIGLIAFEIVSAILRLY